MEIKAQKIEMMDIEDLIPYARNARVHSAAQVDQIADMIRELGFKGAILIDKDNDIVAGHGRVLALKKLGVKKVPVIRDHEITKKQAMRYRIADNKLYEMGAWDRDILKLELDSIYELEQAVGDLDGIGFDDEELLRIIGTATAPKAQSGPLTHEAGSAAHQTQAQETGNVSPPRQEGLAFGQENKKQQIRNDCENGILVCIGFCDILISRNHPDFKVFYEAFGSKYNYGQERKDRLLAALLKEVSSWKL